MAATNVEDVTTLLNQFKFTSSQEPCDLTLCKLHLSQLLKKIPFLQSYSLNSQLINKDELHIIIQTLELAIFYSLKLNDMVLFERYFAQLSVFYYNTRQIIPFETTEYLILAANLLFLISFNRIPEFHMSLELLSSDDKNNEYIAYVVDIQNNLMTGNYKKVLFLSKSPPNAIFEPLLSLLFSTVRIKLANCLEKSYTSIKINEAINLLVLSNYEDLVFFIKQENQRKSDSDDIEVMWSIIDDNLVFTNISTQKNSSISPYVLIDNCIHYATDLERIV